MNDIDVFRQEPRGLALPDAPAMPRAQTDRIDLRWLLATLRRRRRMLAGITLGVLALALLFTFLQKPVYVATSRVVLNVNADQIAPDSRQVQATELTQDAADTEIEVLRSRNLAERTADALMRERPALAALLIDPNPGIAGRIKAAVLGAPPADADANARRERLIDSIIDNSSVQRTGSTFAVGISFGAPEAAAAATVANQIATVYTQGQFNDKKDSNRTATKFLSKRLEELRLQANADNAGVQRYRIANNLLSTSGTSLTEQEISTYNQRVADARTDASGDQARLATARAQLRAGSKGDDVGEALSSSVVSGLRSKRAEVSGRLASLNARYGELNPDVKKAKSELADVDEEIAAEIKRVISNLEAKAEVSQGRLGAISGSLAAARGTLAQNNAAAVQLDDLQRRADASQQLYESYLNRYKELSAKEGTERSDARLISSAVAPRMPSSPNMPLNAALGLLVGLGIGLAAAFAAEMGFAGITTSDDVERRLGQRYLGATPLVRKRDAGALPDMPFEKPKSLFSQSLQNIRASMVHAAGEEAQIFALTSALPGEGKTTSAMALVRSLALSGDRCVLVDCDFRRRRLSKMIGTPGTVGLIEVLKGEATVEQALVRDDRTGALILPIVSDAGDDGALMAGPRMNEVLDHLRERFRFVILDTPPVLPVPETREILAKADATVLLVRWRRTADHAVATAMRMLPSDFIRIVGVVLTAINVSGKAGGGIGDPSYYHKQYQEYLN